VHILNFQRDLVVGWIIHIELINYVYIYISILILYLEEVLLAQYVKSNRQRDLVATLEHAPILRMIIICIVFLYIHFRDLKMAHSGRNMSSSA